MSKEEKKLRVESEHAQFVAKCIYEKAKEKMMSVTYMNFAEMGMENAVLLSDLAEICNQPPSCEDTIAKLQEEVERLRRRNHELAVENASYKLELQSAKKEQGGWVAVSERLPEKEGYYLTYSSNLDGVVWFNPDTDCWEDCVSKITHWQPLPEPPPLQKPSEGGSR